MDQASSRFVGFWNQAERIAVRRPWRCAVLLTPLLFAVIVAIFQPAYETNDDAAMSMIASGKLIATVPDEHLIFSHPLIGLLLKQLYTHAPSWPWYALYLLATQVAAHTVIAGLLLLYCPLRPALTWLALWLGTIGIYFCTHLQFTTTAFLAGMAGVLLLWEAANRVCARSLARNELAANQAAHIAHGPATTRPVLGLLLAGSALLLWCEMIRWYMFYLIVALPLPAIAVWWLWKLPGWRITARAAGVAALLILGGFGLKELHLAYYHADPVWRNFYEYNELRAQFNDTVKVVYNEQTRASFEQAGWQAIDMQMMSSWCYDDAEVFSLEKLQQIWDSRTWRAEHKPLKATLLDLQSLLQESPLRLYLFLLAVLTFTMPLDRRHLSFNITVLGTAIGAILLLSVMQKLPPPRVYMPIMGWTVVAISWNMLSRSIVHPGTPPALSIWQVCQRLLTRPVRFDSTSFRFTRKFCLAIPVSVVVLGLGVTIKNHYKFQAQRSAAQRELLAEFHSFQPDASKLYVLWAASIPMENLNPLSSLDGLSNLRMLWFGWPQQMPTHQAMKAHYGISNLMREWSEHPEVQVICPAICTEFYANYAKAHYAQDIRAVPAGTLLGNPIFRFQKADADTLAEQPQVSVQTQ